MVVATFFSPPKKKTIDGTGKLVVIVLVGLVWCIVYPWAVINVVPRNYFSKRYTRAAFYSFAFKVHLVVHYVIWESVDGLVPL